MRRSSFFRALVWGTVFSGLTLSSTWTPAGAATFKSAPLFNPADVSLQTLPNGVRSIFKPAPGSDVVAIQVWVRAGSRYEPSAQAGIAHLLETAAVTASKNYPARSDDNGGLDGAIRGLGGDSASLTSRDATFYSVTVAAPYAANAMKAVADAVLNPTLSNSAIEDAKLTASNDLTGRAFDAVSTASDIAYSAAYAKNPYRRPAWGTDTSLAGLTGAAVRTYHQKLYVGPNISVVVVGDIAKATAQKMVANAFAGARKGVKAEIKNVAEKATEPITLNRRAGLGRDAVALAWRSPAIDKPNDVVAMDTLLALWSEGVDAKLRKILLRDGEDSTTNGPLTSAYNVDFLTQYAPGLFMVTLNGTLEKDEAVRAVNDEIERIRKGISPEETQKARDLLRRQYVEQSENPAGQAGALGFYDMIGSYDFAVTYMARCARVTSADLSRVASTYLAPDKLVRVDVAPLRVPQPEVPKNGQSPIITASWPLNASYNASDMEVAR